MNYQTIFDILNAAVLPAWFALVFLPHWRWTQPLAQGLTVPLLAAGYVVLVAAALMRGGGGEGPDFTTIEGVASIFSHPSGVVAGWAHYLAFDLFVGAWVGRDSRRRAVPHLLVVPCLILCFLAGPAGYLLYLGLRRAGPLRPGMGPE